MPPESGNTNGRFTYVVPQLPPDRVCVTAITQTPAAIFSADGIATPTLLPATLGCRITGAADESARRVTCDKPLELIAWWPVAWGTPVIRAGDRDLPGTLLTFGDEQFVRCSVEKGDWTIAIGPQ